MKIRIKYRTCKALDWSFWSIAIGFAFWADWRIGVALLAFDVMRVFEDLARDIEKKRREAGNKGNQSQAAI